MIDGGAVGIVASFMTGASLTFLGAAMRARNTKINSDDNRVVEWAKLLGSLEASMTGFCRRLNHIETCVQRLDGLPFCVAEVQKKVDGISDRLDSQSEALARHQREETQILRELRGRKGD